MFRGNIDGFSGDMLYIAIDNQGNGLFASGFKAISNFFTKGISTSTLAKAPLKRNATFFAGVKLDGIPLKGYIGGDDNRQIAWIGIRVCDSYYFLKTASVIDGKGNDVLSCLVVRVKCVLVVIYGRAIPEIPLPRSSSFGIIDELNEIFSDEVVCVDNIFGFSAVCAVIELVY